jgi:hypothetical protein
MDPTAEIAADSSKVRRLPHLPESAHEPPKIFPTMPEIEPKPKAKPTDVADKPT